MVLGSFYYYDYILGAHKAAVSYAVITSNVSAVTGAEAALVDRHVSQELQAKLIVLS